MSAPSTPTPRRALDTAAMKSAVAEFLAGVKPRLADRGEAGVTARFLMAMLPPFVDAMAIEMESQQEGVDILLGIVAVMSNIAGSAARTLQVDGESPQDRLDDILARVRHETLWRLDKGKFANIRFQQAGSA